jgi:hypothetical protein
VKRGLCGKDAYTVLVTEISWYWMTQEKDEIYSDEPCGSGLF